jgi:hypothetical protein
MGLAHVEVREMILFINRLLCKIGIHKWTLSSYIGQADMATCVRCGKREWKQKGFVR